jgi:hypothetical protein
MQRTVLECEGISVFVGYFSIFVFLPVKFPNSNSISCYNSSLLECSTAVQEVVISNHGWDMSVSGGALIFPSRCSSERS